MHMAERCYATALLSLPMRQRTWCCLSLSTTHVHPEYDQLSSYHLRVAGQAASRSAAAAPERCPLGCYAAAKGLVTCAGIHHLQSNQTDERMS